MSKRSRTRTASAEQPAAIEFSTTSIAIIWALFFSRWLTTTEGSAQGETLWLTTIGLAACAAFALWNFRTWQQAPALTRFDVAVLMLCGAHVLAAIIAVLSDGRQRSTVNMLWEWTNVAAVYFVLRQTLKSELRVVFLQTMIAFVLALVAYGMWQHYVWYPSNIAEYSETRQELDELEALAISGRASSTDQRRLRELQSQFVTQGVPLDGPRRGLFERRLRDSTEPLGFFALTNTFAGLQAILFVMLAGLAAHQLFRMRPASGRFWTAAICVCLVAPAVYSLLLTKSRTAMCAAVAGLITLAFVAWLRSRSTGNLRGAFVLAIALLLIGGALVAGAAVSGSIDAEVISEAPKSFEYRLQYWTATGQVIRQDFLFGTGPGNFRDNYLRHKLAVSSEEIADPHQMLLDVAANAGIPGVIGLLTLIGFLIRNVLSSIATNVASSTSDVSNSAEPTSTHGYMAIVFSGLLIVATEFVFEGAFNVHVMSVCAIAVAILFVLRKLPVTTCRQLSHAEITILSGSLVAILVHLSGAGGIAMPAIIGAVFALGALVDSAAAVESDSEQSTATSAPTRAWLVIACVYAFALLGCAKTAFVPVLESQSLLATADYELTLTGNGVRAQTLYREASEVDPLSYEPWSRLADLEFQRWQNTRDDAAFDESIRLANEALRRAPEMPALSWQIARMWSVRLKFERNPEIAEPALASLKTALAGYPTQPAWNAEYAIALSLCGKTHEATEAARKTITLDDLNRSAGHIDRYLPKAVRLDQEALVEEIPLTTE